ncbi:ATP-binding protein [Streptomyces sp. NPDC057694]|uniref:ATP-binding protein n=1 Tax=Streptomyces sp. NPDC057694 TaxID=3346216 RepID=UPI0036A4E29A
MSHLLTALSYLAALPRIRWSLRAVRNTTRARPSLDDLLPTGRPRYWNRDAATFRWAGQARACSELMSGILNEEPRVRNRSHFLIGPPGCGKTTATHWVYKCLDQAGKKVTYVSAPAWTVASRPIHVSSQMRDRLVHASQELDLLIVDEADAVTVEALQSLRLNCPVLIVGRAPGELDALTHLPSDAGVVVDLTPEGGTWPARASAKLRYAQFVIMRPAGGVPGSG